MRSLLCAAVCLSLYVAGRPVQTESIKQHPSNALEGESSSPALNAPTLPSTLSGSSASEYEVITVPGGQVRLTPKIWNQIWKMKKDLIPQSNAAAIKIGRDRKVAMGMGRYEPLPSEKILGRMPSTHANLSKPDKSKLRLKYLELNQRSKALKDYKYVHINEIEKAYFEHLKDPKLKMKTAVKKQYAKFAIENKRVTIDPQTEEVIPYKFEPAEQIGRTYLPIDKAAPATLRFRKYYPKRNAARRQATAARKEALALEKQNKSSLEDEPGRGSQSRQRSYSTQSMSSGDQAPDLVWPPSAKRQRTPRIVVDEAANPALQFPSINDESREVRSRHKSAKRKSLKDIISAPPTPNRYPPPSPPTPSVVEQSLSPPPSPLRLRNDGLQLDMNELPAEEID